MTGLDNKNKEIKNNEEQEQPLKRARVDNNVSNNDDSITTKIETSDNTNTTTTKTIIENHNNKEVISSQWYKNNNSKESREKKRSEYKNAHPYHHGMMDSFCNANFLENVLKELKQNTKVKFKESDLFRVYQSIDLGNVTEGSTLANEMPFLYKLKQTLYSNELKSMIERISCLDPGTLTDQVDCAVNCHNQGCHLLCHDDVIGNRKISFILYLTDSTTDQPWTKEYGGALELYDITTSDTDATEKSGLPIPKPYPCKSILPLFNRLAYFAVQPGISFHSVQEVFVSDRPRLSIQGWYHCKEIPKQMEYATLNRLKDFSSSSNHDDGYDNTPFNELQNKVDGEDNDDDLQQQELTQEDIEYLSQYINPIYLHYNNNTTKILQEIRDKFEEESSIQLCHFLVKDWNAKVTQATMEKDTNDKLGNSLPPLNYYIGSSDDTHDGKENSKDNEGWIVRGPPHKQRYLEYIPTAPPTTPNSNNKLDSSISLSKEETEAQPTTTPVIGQLLQKLKLNLFSSPSFARLLQHLTTMKPTASRGHIRRFRPGMDYTVAHYGNILHEGCSMLDATLCFADVATITDDDDDDNKEEEGDEGDEDVPVAASIWESGDVGGFECYIAADDEDEEEQDETKNNKKPKEADDQYNEEDDDTELLSVAVKNNTLSLVYRDPGTMKFVKYVGCSAPSSRWDITFEYQVEDDDEMEDEVIGDDCSE